MLNNLRNSEEFDALEARLRDLATGRDIIFSPARGNWGDGLIHKGVEQFLSTRKIPHKTLMREQVDALRESLDGTAVKLSQSVLLNCGGGSWSEKFHGTHDFVSRNAKLFEEVVVLPSTFELGAVQASPGKVTYFARDKFTSFQNIPESVFCHDMAFYLELPVAFDVPRGRGTGYFMREDKERSAGARVLGPSLDLSLLGNQRSRITPFFVLLAPYRKIVTDRMHVAIAGAMLNKSVDLYAGSYFKSIDVFKSTIEPNYSGVRIMKW